MWALRILNGPQSGENYPLKEGENFIGRNPNLDISLSQKGVSKRHCKIKVEGNVITLIDLGSSNGTFVNGKMIKEHVLQPGDKIAFHNVIADVNQNVIAFPNLPAKPQGEQAPSIFENQNHEDGSAEAKVERPKSLKETVELYIENVVMPLVYKLIENYELRWVIGGFVLAFIVMVSSLSTIPMIQITKSSIEKESQRRALTIARYIVDKNKALIQQNLTSSLTVRVANKEEGVKLAAIIDADTGRILAPAAKAGSYENRPFLNMAREVERYKDYEYVETMIDGTIGASVPIRMYDPSKQTTIIKAYAIVLYDSSAISVDDGQSISLFMQTLIIACLLGFILYFFLYRLVEKPIAKLNHDINDAMKDGKQVQTPYQFPPLQDLLTNINSLVSRANESGTEGPNFDLVENNDKSFEAQNIVRLFSNAAISVREDKTIIDCNMEFENLTGVISGNIQNQALDTLNDQALILSIEDLIDRCKEQPSLIASNQIEFSGIQMEIDAQAVMGAKNIEYYVLTIKQQGGVL
tara:strand:- start:11194 stop:12765 length:1572 start_codon:yes stop_codon:yes gene_type:complete